MFTKKKYPEQVSGKDLDDYLARGWYRMGQSIFTCHFLSFGERLYSAVWLRLRLEGFKFKKRQRKLMRKNEHFRIVIQDASLDQQKEDLYQKYRWYCFKGNISISLKDSLLDGKNNNAYDTLECCIYDEDKLIAVSFFDYGNTSLSSILGMYDPDYQSHSLGYYSMLLEIQYGLDQGFQYYYPGYIVPGYSRFNYKARIGPVDCYSLTKGTWSPLKQVETSEYPLNEIAIRLEELQAELQKHQVSSRIYYYPLFETHIFAFWDINYLKYPVFLWCDTPDGQSDYLLLVYDLVKQRYLILQCALLGQLPVFLEELFEESNEDQPAFLETLSVKQKILVDYNLEDLAIAIARLKRVRRLK
ncbi:MAG: arginine-tRNA-protein transferase [Bacteroidota bacterium]